MPTYQYQCDDCGNAFEQFQKFSDDPLTVCPDCGGTIRRVIGNVGVVFKGSGWYITDSRSKSSDSGSGSTSSAKPKTDSTSKPESKPAESAPASSEAKPAAPAASA